MKSMSPSTREWLTNNMLYRLFTSDGMKVLGVMTLLGPMMIIPNLDGTRECEADGGRLTRARVQYVGKDSQGGHVEKDVYENVCTYPKEK